MKTTIIYISGLGDRYDRFRGSCLRFWNTRFGAEVIFVPMRWRDASETADQKLQRISDAIDRTKSERIVLVGESAGASAAFVAGSVSSKVVKVVTLCGKTIRADRVSRRLYRQNPAFETMMKRADEVNSSRKENDVPVLALRAYADPVVALVDMSPKGVDLRRFPSVAHIIAIMSGLTVLWPVLYLQAKR